MKVENQTECLTIDHLVTFNVASKGHHVACIGMARQFKIPPHDRFPYQITNLSSHIGMTNKIVKEKLTLTQLVLFKKTVFGRFVDVDIIFNSPLVHYIILRESPNPVVVRRAEGTKSLYNRYLGKDFAGDIHIGTLETMYKEMEFDNDRDAVKMTLIYYTELAMMGREKMKTNVDKILLIDVEDLDYFNSMDW
ncbi:uncharacterized protein LOC120077431 [Benincasa hispida]|uniref:uncharacterized protein LOC120077431 n=1 Tax=Benincasa hispida TaxID=102211 RepID=UPI00190286AD|nr:uncharacterized protein LOC120077431 [Benincasa hispida]